MCHIYIDSKQDNYPNWPPAVINLHSCHPATLNLSVAIEHLQHIPKQISIFVFSSKLI